MDQRQMLLEIQKLGFAAIELNLYLDTHPEEIEPLNHYNRVTEELNRLKIQYEKMYGPLTAYGLSTSRYPWQWVEGPWPWEVNS